MKRVLLSRKYCKTNAFYYGQIIPPDIDEENYFNYGVQFKVGIINTRKKYDFHVPQIRTKGQEHVLNTFRDLGFQEGDRIRFDGRYWLIKEVSISFIQSTQFKSVKHFFLTVS